MTVIDQNRILILGGSDFDGELLSDVYVLDAETMNVTMKATPNQS